VADAEIIPLGTRGRPGRGTGREKPSSSSRSLAPGRAGGKSDDEGTDAPTEPDTTVPVPGDDQQPSGGPVATPPPAAEDTETPGDPAADETPSAESDAATEGDQEATITALPGRDEPDVEAEASVDVGAPAGSAEVSSPGVPFSELLGAARSAATLVFGDDADRRLAELLAFMRRRVTGDYEVDEYGLDT
jgi:hypothetical protein